MAQRTGIWKRVAQGPMALGLLATAAFYGCVYVEPLRSTFIHKYTTEHATEVVIVAMFFWGMADLLLRCLGFGAERRALDFEWLPERSTQEPPAAAASMLLRVKNAPKAVRSSRISKRLQQALIYVEQKQSADGFDDHLRDLSDRDADTTHANFAVTRFIVWVTPILGFLGTVVHFGTALGGIAPDELAEKLPLITTGMGTAFNTTSVALAVSITMMFLLFVAEQAELRLVRRIDAIVDAELANRFTVDEPSIAPFLRAVERGANETLKAVADLAQAQARSAAQLQHAQQQQFHEIQSHHARLWSNSVAEQRQAFEQLVANIEARSCRVLEQLAGQFAEYDAATTTAFAQTTELQQNLANVGAAVAEIFKSEGRLVEMQDSLARNLILLQETQKLDEAVNGLTAAIHLMTARHIGSPARDMRAA